MTAKPSGTYYFSDIVSIPADISIKSGRTTVSYPVIGITANAFKGANVQSISISKRSTGFIIGKSAFEDCELHYFSIAEASSITIAERAFAGIKKIQSFTYPENQVKFENSVFYGSKDLQWIKIPAVVPDSMFYGCTKFEGGTSMDKAVLTSIGKAAFMNTNLDDWYIDLSSLRSMGESAFENSSISSVTLPDAFRVIKKRAFANCRKLEYVNLSRRIDNVVEIEDEAFQNCAVLNEFAYGGSITSVGRYAFSGCKSLESLDLGELTEIGEGAFSRSGLKSSLYPPVAKNIPAGVFNCCYDLEEVILPYGVTEIGDSAFAKCVLLTNINIPPTLKRIGKNAFEAVNFSKELQLGEGLEAIGEEAFKNCENIEVIGLPTTLKSIAKKAFYGVPSTLIRTFLYATANPVYVEDITNNPANTYVVIPKGTAETFKARGQWKDFQLEEAYSRCETPTLVKDGNTLRFECATPGATIHCRIGDLTDNSFDLSDIVLKFYASAVGYVDSEEVSFPLSLDGGASSDLNADLNGNGIIDIQDIKMLVDKLLGK